MNSPAARSNATRESRPARMRRLLAEEKPCECGEPALIRQPKGNGTGSYESLCLDCAAGMSHEDRLAELLAMLDAID
jgi:hypothetical protein